MLAIHGSYDNKGIDGEAWAPHSGACFTDCLSSALDYAEGGYLIIVELDDSGSTEVAGYDHDTDTAPGDTAPEALPAPVVTFDDQAINSNREHRTWRLRDAGRATIVRVIDLDDYDHSDWGGYSVAHILDNLEDYREEDA